MNKENKFYQIAYKYNKVEDVSEAFKEYNPLDEIHKGKIENVIHDNIEIYNSKYNVGDIVFAKEYIYSNGKKGYNHLFVIIDINNTVIPIEKFSMLISSKLDKIKYKNNILLKKDKNNNLKTDSIVKTDKVYKLIDDQILFKVGVVDNIKLNIYKSYFYNSVINN